MRISTILTLCFLSLHLHSQNPILEWANGLGSTATDYGQAVAIDPSGNVISVGFFQGTIDLDPGSGSDNHTSQGNFDGYVSKVDKDGIYLWGFRIGQTLADGINGVDIDASGNIYITGLFTGTVDVDPSGNTYNLTSFSEFSVDAFWAKYDPNGNFLNAYAWGGAGYDQGNDIKVGSTGEVHIIGDFEQTVDFAPSAAVINRSSNGGHDIFISRFNTSYLLNYVVTIGTSETTLFTDHGSGIDIDNSNNIYISGFFQGTMDMDPYGTPTNISSTNSSSPDGFIAKYNGSESLQWAKGFGSSSIDRVHDCTVDNDGNMYVTGEFTNAVNFNPGGTSNTLTSSPISNADAFVCKYNTSGDLQWAFRAGGVYASDVGHTIATNNTAIFVGGNFRGTNVNFNPDGSNFLTSTGGTNGFLASYDLLGNHLWSGGLNPVNNCEVYGIDTDGTSRTAVTGKFYGTTDFDTGAGTLELTPIGTYDAFVAGYRSLNTETNFIDFSIPEQITAAVIDESNHTIDVVVPNGTDVSSLVSTFSTSPGASVHIGLSPQTSGVTINNYNSPITYRVTAEDGTTFQDWIVSIISPPTISNFSPMNGPIGTTVTIVGTGFDSTPINNVVFFGATQAIVSTASKTQLTVTVPSGASYMPITILANGLLAYSSSPFKVTFGGEGIDASSVTSKMDYTAGDTPFSIAIGDLDGDGKADLAVANQASNTISIFRNTSTAGSISYAPKYDFGTGLNPISVAIGDLDGDGKLDLAVANFNSNTVSTYRNIGTIGTINFSSGQEFATGLKPRSVAIGDVDSDGRADLAVTNQNSNTVSLFRNTSTIGAISYAAKLDLVTGTTPTSVAIRELDGDGKADLVVSNANSNSLYVWRNTSANGVISYATSIEVATGQHPLSFSIGDVDGDNIPDLVVPNFPNGNSTLINVIRNTSTSGAISFASKVDITTGAGPWAVAMGDIDGDGKTDLAIANPSGNTLSTLRNTSTIGSVSFAANIDFETDIQPYSVALGDLDGDGKADLVSANGNGGSVSVFKNTVPIIDTDGDGIADLSDIDDDNDGILDGADYAPLDPTLCGDDDGDTCDDCSVGVDGFGPLADFDTANDGTDTDADGICDSGDTDDDNDGVLDGADYAPLDPTLCGDDDGDTCDDCSVGVDGFGPLADFDTDNDGTDTDGDGLCDSGDTDDDNDGVLDGADYAPLDPTLCGDDDGDTCDDCSVGVDGFGPLADFDTDNDGTDTDADGICDSGDTDDDNDGVLDVADINPLDPTICQDADSDSCDDCSAGVDGFGPLADFDTTNDGTDTDADGICDSGDTDDDNDGVLDTHDSAPLNNLICSDTDADGCDDCASGTFDTNNDGTDTDGDGLCDSGDTDDDNDGVLDVADINPLDPTICQDADSDSCDDCSVGVDGFGPLADFDTANDGTDTDGDGICDSGDTDDDNDGVLDTDDSAPLNNMICSDTDADGCDDCSSGTYDIDNDGTDTDSDGLCDSGDTDDDNDGVLDTDDSAPLNNMICSDTDADGCDDCASGTYDINNDGTDTDSDGICDSGDTDDDNDGVLDANDLDSLDPSICGDLDTNGCDDCATGTDGFGPLADNVGDILAPVPNIENLSDINSECALESITAPTAVDDCSGTIDGVSNVAFPISTKGNTVITWTYEDAAGNTSSQDQTVTINDQSAPTPIASSLPDLTDECSIPLPTSPTASDNCIGTINGTTDVIFPITEIGTTVVTWSFEDDNGNVTTQTQNAIISGLENSLTQSGNTITANASGATYQWLDCDNGNTPIDGETNQSFTAHQSGNFAVEIDNGECNIVSDCISATITVVTDQIGSIDIFPNPTNGLVKIKLDDKRALSIQLLSLDGKEIQNFGSYFGSNLELNLSNVNKGVYLFRINTNENHIVKKIVLK